MPVLREPLHPGGLTRPVRRPLTVVQLLPALEAGGVERSTLEIAAALVEAGHRAIVVSAGGRLLPALAATGAEHVPLAIGKKSLATLATVRPLRALLHACRADIVHARSRLPAWIGRLALRGMGSATPRWVTTMHGLNSPSAYSRIMASGERVICVSATVRDYLLQHYPATPADTLRVIPRGIDPLAFPRRTQVAHAARAALAGEYPALGGTGPLLLLPGRGTRLKGHAQALHLLARLRASGTDARLWMPGARAPQREAYLTQLQQQAAQLGISDAVAITPATAAMADAYAMSDLVLQLSQKPEAFGRTVLEALAVGVPVLGWAHGGVGELLHRLQPEGAVPLHDEAALLHRAQALLHAPPEPGATMPYTLAAMQAATLSVYHELA